MVNLKQIAKLSNIRKAKQIKTGESSRAIERLYYKQLKRLTNELKEEVNKNILPLLKTNKVKDSMTTDGVSELLAALNALSFKFSSIFTTAQKISNDIVERVNNTNKNRFYKGVTSAVGVDLENIINEEGLQDIVALQKNKNVSLITSIPQEFIKNIEIVVQNGVSEGLSVAAITKQINGIKDISSVYGKLENRIKTIARNEVSTINGKLNKARQESVGVDKYIFRTAKDEKVRGNPQGKYPNARPSHWVMEGKICRWDDPTVYKDNIDDKEWKKRSSIGGVEEHPSIPINCRCIAEGIVD